jgi:hypothetical protein
LRKNIGKRRILWAKTGSCNKKKITGYLLIFTKIIWEKERKEVVFF